MIFQDIFLRKLFLFLFCVQLLTGCSYIGQDYIIFKTEKREQLTEKSIKYCHGDFKILEEIKFGPYTKAILECIE